MDSKLRRAAILATALAVITVLLVVVLQNASKLKLINDKNETAGFVIQQETEPAISMNKNGFVMVGKSLDAWKNDELFFDREKGGFAAYLMEKMKSLSLRVISVERDLRIQILDYEGSLKTGEKFIVSITDSNSKVTDYADEDCDGRIIINKLRPGQYEVTLKPIGDYLVPDEAEIVTVKDSVEYIFIEDIPLMITTEDSLSAAKEDLMEITALEDAASKQDTSYGKNPDIKYGVDISSRDGEIDWTEVYDSGIRFAILRAGYRGAKDGKLYVDSKFYENAKAAYRAGIDIGLYFYSQAVNEREAVEEASTLLLLSSDLDISLPLFIRFDRAGGQGRADEITEETRTLITDAFAQTVKNMGYEPGIYASVKWMKMNLESGNVSEYGYWMADYNKTPTYEGWYDIWQYSSKGKVKGISKEVFLSLIYNREKE